MPSCPPRAHNQTSRQLARQKNKVGRAGHTREISGQVLAFNSRGRRKRLLLGARKIDIEFLLHYRLEVSALENVGRRVVGERVRRSVVAAGAQF